MSPLVSAEDVPGNQSAASIVRSPVGKRDGERDMWRSIQARDMDRAPFSAEIQEPPKRAIIHPLHPAFDGDFFEVVERAAGYFEEAIGAAERKYVVGRGGLGVDGGEVSEKKELAKCERRNPDAKKRP